MPDREEYLHDGLYASFDGFGFKLRAPRDGVDHWVYLEDRTLAEFDRYRKKVEARLEARARERAAKLIKVDAASAAAGEWSHYIVVGDGDEHMPPDDRAVWRGEEWRVYFSDMNEAMASVLA